MTSDFSNAVWATAQRNTRGRNTVSDKVDVYIGRSTNNVHKNEYMVVRFYKKKFAEVFGEITSLSVGFIGNYLLLKAGNDYKLYNTENNPEIRILVDEVKKCGRDADKMLGGYLLKKDDAAGLCFVDTSVGARA